MTIRRALISDAPRINDLLYQVAKLHSKARPDIFKKATKKYADDELMGIIECNTTPIFVATDDRGYVLGYAFCISKCVKDNILLQDKKTLYIDDLCVDEAVRGQNIGKSLYEYVVEFAKEKEFDNITLNVWAFNEGAYKFYEKCGMTPQRIFMEQTVKS